MKVSIVVPIYNSEKYLHRCLDSIINQTYKDLEIILIDDGSKDGSYEICEEYKKLDSRIILIYKENEGVSSARNIGISLATGDYIGFVDSDDWIEKDMYQILSNVAKEYHSDIAVCKMAACKDYKNESYFHTRNHGKTYMFSNKNAMNYIFAKNKNNIVLGPSLCNKLIKLSLIKNNKISFNKKITIGEDLLFFCECLQHNAKVVFVNRFLYNYFMNPLSATHKDFNNSYLTIFDAHDIIINTIALNHNNLKKSINAQTAEWSIGLIIKKIYISNNNDINTTNLLRSRLRKNMSFLLMSKSTKLRVKLYGVLIYINPKLTHIFWKRLKNRN